MTSSRFVTGFLVCALAPMMLASLPADAQVNDYADGAVTIDMGALPGGGYGYTETISSEPSVTPSYGRGLILPGPNRPRSELFVTPQKSGATPKLRVTRSTPTPAPTSRVSRLEVEPRPVVTKEPVSTPPQPAARPQPAEAAPAQLTAATPPPPAAPSAKPMGAETQTAEIAPPAPAPKSPAPKSNAAPPPPPPPASTAGVAPPPPPPPPATATPVPTPPAPKAESVASLTPGEDGRLIRVVFDESESKLPDAAKANLQKLADQVKDQNDVRLQLLAYAGGGDLKSNRARRLSLSRALSVRSFLIESGIRSTRIDVRALGDKTSDEPKNRVDITLGTR